MTKQILKRLIALSLLLILNSGLFSLSAFGYSTEIEGYIEEAREYNDEDIEFTILGITDNLFNELHETDTDGKQDCEKETAKWYAFERYLPQAHNPYSASGLYLNDGDEGSPFSGMFNQNKNIFDEDIFTIGSSIAILTNEEAEEIKNSINGVIRVPGCCHSYASDIRYDENKNCQLDTGEECRLRKQLSTEIAARVCQAQIANSQASTSGELNTSACSLKFSCDGERLTSTSSDEFNPYSSEYFIINDQEKGLSTEGQGSSFFYDPDNPDQGPIFTAFKQLTSIMVGLVSTIAFAVLIIGAYLLITSNGEENKIEKGKNSIKYALLGIMFVLLSFTIVRLVQSILF